MTTLSISHSSNDKDWVNDLSAELEKNGYRKLLFVDCHREDGIQAGQKWEKQIYQNLRQARGIVVLCTKSWLASPWCVAEAILAREKGKPMFLLAAREISETANDGQQTHTIPWFLQDTQFIKLAEQAAEQIGINETDQLQRSLLLAVESLRRRANRMALKTLRQGLTRLSRRVSVIHHGPVQSVAMSGGGRCIAGATGKKVHIWSPEGEQLGVIELETQAINQALSEGGQYIGAATERETAVWDVATAEQISRIDGRATSLMFSPDNSTTDPHCYALVTGGLKMGSR
jgi:hypothetical protein